MSLSMRQWGPPHEKLGEAAASLCVRIFPKAILRTEGFRLAVPEISIGGIGHLVWISGISTLWRHKCAIRSH